MSHVQGFPQLNSRLVSEDGEVQFPWDFLFLNLWKRTGSSIPTDQLFYLYYNGIDLFAVNSENGMSIRVLTQTDLDLLQSQIDFLQSQIDLINAEIAAISGDVGDLTTIAWARGGPNGKESSNSNNANRIANAYAFSRR